MNLYVLSFIFLFLIGLAYPLNRITFQDLTYDEIVRRSRDIAGLYANVNLAETIYGLRQAKQGSTTCSPIVMQISHVKSLSLDKQRPQLLISGEIHGDERVGPSSSILLAELLVWSAKCEIDMDNGACSKLVTMGINNDDRIWLAYLATKRDTYILPAANCLGYILNRRDDAGVDPNRDFPYSRSDEKCFLSTTAKLFDKIMIQNLIQMVVTFHGGMAAIGYEWGTRTHPAPNDQSPDDVANKDIAQQMQTYAGAFTGVSKYDVGRINSLVYPVEGGMEDWLYAAGWDKSELKRCQGDFKGVEDVQNRAIVFLVETSDRKKPHDDSLGGPHLVLDARSPSNGHVPRNTRLGLLAIDVVEPYTCITDLSLQREKNGNVMSFQLDIKWKVGGGMKVDATWLTLHRHGPDSKAFVDSHSPFLHNFEPPDVSENVERTYSAVTELSQISSSNSSLSTLLRGRRHLEYKNEASMKFLQVSPIKKGYARWGRNDQNSYLPTIFASTITFANQKLYEAKAGPSGTILNNSTVITLPRDAGEYWLVAWSKVDQDWATKGQGYPKNLDPQSHLINARTNPKWRYQTPSGKEVRGRLLWPSDPILITVSENGEVSIRSSVLNCAWWNRGQNNMSDSKGFISKLEPNFPYSKPTDSIHNQPPHTNMEGIDHGEFDTPMDQNIITVSSESQIELNNSHNERMGDTNRMFLFFYVSGAIVFLFLMWRWFKSRSLI